MPTTPAHLLAVIPAELDAEVDQLLDRAHGLDLVLSRDDIVYSESEGLLIDGMPASDWITAVGEDVDEG